MNSFFKDVAFDGVWSNGWIKTATLLILPVAIALSGSSVLANFYVRNLTGQEKDIMLISYEDVNSRLFQFEYTNAPIKKIRFNTFKELKKKIKSEARGNIIHISLPPMSALYIGPGNNFHQMFDERIVNNDTLDLDETSKFKTSSQFF